jgi:competence protein ComEA
MRKLILVLIAACGLVLATPANAGPVNVNTADAKTLAKELEGVGLARAKAIIAHREKHGPFKTADDLKKVSGVGSATVERNRANIMVDANKPATAKGG